eukprot:Hpha_TRINITY_DN15629_c1_g1::TRINITY_DN15629_c1_g1_i1::g.99591::m.99591
MGCCPSRRPSVKPVVAGQPQGAWHNVALGENSIVSRSELDSEVTSTKTKRKKKKKSLGSLGGSMSEKDRSESTERTSQKRKKKKKKPKEGAGGAGPAVKDVGEFKDEDADDQEVGKSESAHSEKNRSGPKPEEVKDPPADSLKKSVMSDAQQPVDTQSPKGEKQLSPRGGASSAEGAPAERVNGGGNSSAVAPAPDKTAVSGSKSTGKRKSGQAPAPLDYEPLSSRKMGRLNTWVESLPRRNLLDPVEFVQQRYARQIQRAKEKEKEKEWLKKEEAGQTGDPGAHPSAALAALDSEAENAS